MFYLGNCTCKKKITETGHFLQLLLLKECILFMAWKCWLRHDGSNSLPMTRSHVNDLYCIKSRTLLRPIGYGRSTNTSHQMTLLNRSIYHSLWCSTSIFTFFLSSIDENKHKMSSLSWRWKKCSSPWFQFHWKRTNIK